MASSSLISHPLSIVHLPARIPPCPAVHPHIISQLTHPALPWITLRDIIPLGKVRSNFNFTLEDKRILNFENVVDDSDNIKQDISIDVYGRKEKAEEEAAAAAAIAAAAAAAAAAAEEEAEEEVDELDALLAA
jgi:hypothetical protein